MVIRSTNAVVLQAWVTETHTDGPFAAEAAAAEMALKMVEALHSEDVLIEGDALNVIQSILKGTNIID